MKKQYGRYQVLKRLGGGGMAQVYLGFDPRLRRQVAIKVITALLNNQAMRERFEQEAVAMAQLSHQSIVPIYDFGDDSDGYPYLVMRLMRGGSLAERLKQQGVFSLAEVAQLLERLAPAIDFAHGLGMVHRDLKPLNILLDQQGNPYIADFGLVKLLNASIPWTKSGKMMGSPPYMSPEQGRGLEIDEQTDIYALGVITFELLTGKWPYQAENALGFIYQHSFNEIPNICALNPKLPTALQPIIERVLAKAPKDRYATAGEFAAAIKGLLATRQAAPAQTVSMISLPTAEECLRRGNQYYNQQDYQKAIAQYTQAILLDPKNAYAHLNRGLAYYVQGYTDKGINDYNQACQLKPQSATTFYYRGLAYQHKGQLYEAISDYEQALRINPQYNDATSKRQAAYDALLKRAQSAYQKGQLDKALADCNLLLGLNPIDVTLLTLRGQVYEQKGQVEKALADYDEALRLNPHDVTLLTLRGQVYEQKGHVSKAIADYDEALGINPYHAAAQKARANVIDETLIKDKARLKKLPPKQRVATYLALFNNESLLKSLSPTRRAAFGVDLGKLGDPRKEIMTVDGMLFCYVPPGRFFLGSDAGRNYEKPLHQLDIPYGYWIGRDLVSNAQFQEFVKTGGYRTERYWGEAKAAGVWQNGQVYRRTAPYDCGEPFTLPNHPVVGVAWYEALAFTRWLAERWNSKVGLPSEAEWEKAARGGLMIPATPLIRPATALSVPPPRIGGGQGGGGLTMMNNPLPQRRYPWGDDAEAGHTNSKEAGIGKTSALGLFPQDKSPYGCQEMSGNVWEWTRSLWKPYPYQLDGEREKLAIPISKDRVFRSGTSFYHSTMGVGCPSRDRNSPNFGSNLRGFRVFGSSYL